MDIELLADDMARAVETALLVFRPATGAEKQVMSVLGQALDRYQAHKSANRQAGTRRLVWSAQRYPYSPALYRTGTAQARWCGR